VSAHFDERARHGNETQVRLRGTVANSLCRRPEERTMREPEARNGNSGLPGDDKILVQGRGAARFMSH
jgi:hypothetical protein